MPQGQVIRVDAYDRLAPRHRTRSSAYVHDGGRQTNFRPLELRASWRPHPDGPGAELLHGRTVTGRPTTTCSPATPRQLLDCGCHAPGETDGRTSPPPTTWAPRAIYCHNTSYPAIPQHTTAELDTLHLSTTTGCDPCHDPELTAEHGQYPLGTDFKYQCSLCHASTDPTSWRPSAQVTPRAPRATARRTHTRARPRLHRPAVR